MSAVVYRKGWKLKDPDIERDALEFWGKLKVISEDAAHQRVPEIVCGAYVDDKMVAVATASISYLPNLRAKFAMFRCAVSPDCRRGGVCANISCFSRDVIEDWSLANPYEQVMGFAATVQAPELMMKQREPVWTENGLFLVGFTPRGQQLRAVWFRHAVIE
jgi:hypothetical protein